MSDSEGGQGRQLGSFLRTLARSEVQPQGGEAGHTSCTRPCLAFPYLLHAHHLTHLLFPGTICMHLPSLLLYWNLSGGSESSTLEKETCLGDGGGLLGKVADWLSLLRSIDQVLSPPPRPLSLLPTVPSWSLAAGESNIYRKPPIYKRHGMVRGRQSLAKHGGGGVIINTDGSAQVSRNETMQDHNIVLLATHPLPIPRGDFVCPCHFKRARNYSCPLNPVLPPPQPTSPALCCSEFCDQSDPGKCLRPYESCTQNADNSDCTLEFYERHRFLYQIWCLCFKLF